MLIQLLTPAGYRHTPWKNGGGTTTTIASAKDPDVEGWAGVIWQLGRTPIVTAGPFSDFSGFERMQAVIGGRGLVLETPAGEISLRVPFEPVRYDGATPVVSRLENGPVAVVNLIARKDRCTIDLITLTASGSHRLTSARHIVLAPDLPAEVRIDGKVHAVPGGHALDFEGSAHVKLLAGPLLVASIGPGTERTGP
jgi:uncharacterized protein